MVPALKIENLSYKNILNNLSLELDEKKFYILTGPNGSGKTTLVMSIAGFTKYSGNISILGNFSCKDNIVSLRKDMSILTDISDLLDGTALFNIIYPLINLGYEENIAKKETYTLAKKLNIEYLLTRNVGDLSIKEKKLVQVASTIISAPKLIIIDDTLDDLTDYYKNIVLSYLKKLKKCTILLVTNNEKLFQYADKIIIMKNGKISENDTLENLLTNERIFSQSYIKTPFLADLSHKLRSYDLLDEDIMDIDEMVNKLWE